jgi:hypothetical protein
VYREALSSVQVKQGGGQSAWEGREAWKAERSPQHAPAPRAGRRRRTRTRSAHPDSPGLKRLRHTALYTASNRPGTPRSLSSRVEPLKMSSSCGPASTEGAPSDSGPALLWPLQPGAFPGALRCVRASPLRVLLRAATPSPALAATPPQPTPNRQSPALAQLRPCWPPCQAAPSPPCGCPAAPAAPLLTPTRAGWRSGGA